MTGNNCLMDSGAGYCDMVGFGGWFSAEGSLQVASVLPELSMIFVVRQGEQRVLVVLLLLSSPVYKPK